MFIVLKRKQIIVAVLLIVMFTACTLCLNYVDVSQTVFAKTDKKLPVYAVDRGSEKVIAISFDAAWGADKTRAIVDTLVSHGAKATFFLVGFWVDMYKEEVAYIADNGMEIGNHSRNHLHMSTLNTEKINAELRYVNDAVKTITGKTPKFFRPPYGEYNNSVISAVENMNMIAVQWDVDSLDWKGISANEIIKRIVGKVKCGSIILCHNNSDYILEALPTVLTELTEQGYRFVTMSELVYPAYYYIDAQGVQHSNL